MAKKSIKARYETLKENLAAYIKVVDNRKGVAHSTTPQIVNDKPNGVSIGELITIVTTAKSLHKHVVLEVRGDNAKPGEKTLQINLVDEYPNIPFQLRNPDLY